MPRKSVKYVVTEPNKPIKKESDKRVVFEALQELQEEHGGTFTKAQAMETMESVQPDTNSIQPPKTFARAWWNELANKYGLIVDAEDLEDGADGAEHQVDVQAE